MDGTIGSDNENPVMLTGHIGSRLLTFHGVAESFTHSVAQLCDFCLPGRGAGIRMPVNG